MNVRTYQSAKGNWCFYITISAKDRFRVSTTITSKTEADKLCSTIEGLLPLNKKQVETIVNGGSLRNANKNNFYNTITEYIRKTSSENSWEYSTIVYFRSLINKLRRIYGPNLYTEDINEDWLLAFIRKRNMTVLNSTVHKEVKAIKQVMRYATKKGITDGSSVYNANPKFKSASRPNVIYLTKDELKTLNEVDFNIPHLNTTKDLFLFSAMTGLRYSDAQAIRKCNVIGRTLRFTTKKTNDTLMIPLNDIAYDILVRNDYRLPKMSNQVLNRFIKQMCREAGFNTPTTVIHYRGANRIEETKPKWELVSSHSARKSFISNALMLGVPVTTIMSMSGHKSYSAMQNYVAVADASKKEAVNALNNILS